MASINLAGNRSERLNGAQLYMFAVLALVYACHLIDRTIILVLLEPIKHQFSLNDTQLGMLSGLIFALGTLIAALPLGTLADRHSRKMLLAGCIAVWSGMTVLCGFATGFLSLLFYRMLVGMAEAGLQPTALSMMADEARESQRPKAVAIVHIGIPIGTLLGFLLGGWVATNLGWQQALLLVGAPGILLAAVVLLTLREPVRQRTSSGEAGKDVPTSEFFRLLWRSKPLLHVVVGLVLLWLCTSSTSAWMPSFFIRMYGVDLTTVGLIMSLSAGGAGLVGNTLSGYLAQKVGGDRKDRLMLLAAGGAFCYFPLALVTLLSSSLILSVVTHFTQTIFYFMVFTPGYALAMDLADVRIRARTAALVSMGATAIGYGLGPQIVGFGSDLLRPIFDTQSLRWALVLMMLTVLWCGSHFILAWRHLSNESSAGEPHRNPAPHA